MQQAITFLRAVALAVASLSAAAGQHGWVAESPHFRVLVREAPGLDATTAATAAEDLESVRLHFLAEGLGHPRHGDGPGEMLVVPNRLDLHRLLRAPPSSSTRGITIRGMDREFAVVPWHEAPGPRTVLAHEYAHQLDDSSWPLWFREGRAVFLARRVPAPEGEHPAGSLIRLLERSTWTAWPELMSADQDAPAVAAEHFQAQSWLLVHWLAGRHARFAAVAPGHADQALAALGETGLAEALNEHFAELLHSPLQAPVELPPPHGTPEVRPAAPWEVPLFEAEVQRSLRYLDTAESRLSHLADLYPAVARVHAAYGALHLLRGRQDLAERHYGRALELGEERPRTAYRYAVLLMRPGEIPESRAAEALRFAVLARDRMPHEPTHRLAVVHGRMLRGDWTGAFAELRALARFPGWGRRAEREAREIERRRAAAIRFEPPPALGPEAPVASVTVRLPPNPPAWAEPAPSSASPRSGRRWPPHGTWLTHGRVAWIDCSGGERKLVLHSPYRRYVFRENPERPPRLINRPFREQAFPCDSRGWVVAVAYRKEPDGREIDGELVGVRF